MMITNASVSIYIPTISKNSEGTTIKTWGYKQTPAVAPAETFDADVQPNVLTEAQLQQWGLSNKIADVKKMFCDISANVALNNRAKVVMDDGSFTGYFEIRGTNIWPSHMEALLVPVMGEGS